MLTQIPRGQMSTETNFFFWFSNHFEANRLQTVFRSLGGCPSFSR